MEKGIYIKQENKADRKDILRILNRMINKRKDTNILKELKYKIKIKDKSLNYSNKKFLEDNYKLKEEIKVMKIEIKELKYIRRQNQSLFDNNNKYRKKIKSLEIEIKTLKKEKKPDEIVKYIVRKKRNKKE